MKKTEFFLLMLLLLGGFIARLYRFDNPVADWHSWRQVDTSAVSRNFVKYGFDLLHPRFDDLSNIASGKDNPNGYRFVEFPIYNFFQAYLFMLYDILTLEQWGRLVSIFSSLASVVFLYLLVRKHIGIVEAFFSSFFFAFLPFSIYYSRTILPDTTMVMASLGGIYFFDKWIDLMSNIKDQPRLDQGQISKIQIRNNMVFISSIVFTASAILLKPFAIFFLLPMVYLAFRTFSFRSIKQWQLWLFLILSMLPLILWRLWMQQYPEGIPASDWLFNENNIRFKGAFFYWIFGERISKLILGYLGVSLFLVGFFRKEEARGYLFSISFLISSLLYLFIIAGGNVKHDYYQILIVPTLSIFLARGVSFLLSLKGIANTFVSLVLLPLVILGMFALSWYYVRDYFNINNWGIVKAGKYASWILPDSAKVIAPAPIPGDTAFLYYTGRQGWPAITAPIEKLMQKGATHLVIADPTKSDFEGFGRQYHILASSPSYLILELR